MLHAFSEKVNIKNMKKGMNKPLRYRIFFCQWCSTDCTSTLPATGCVCVLDNYLAEEMPARTQSTSILHM